MTTPTVDAVGTATSYDFSAGSNQSHTCGGSNRVLYFQLAFDRGGGSSHGTGVTYNGVSMTLKGGAGFTSGNVNGGGNNYCEVWELVNPDTGSHSIAWTANDGNARVSGDSVSFQDVDQTTPTGSVATYGPSNSASPSVT